MPTLLDDERPQQVDELWANVMPKDTGGSGGRRKNSAPQEETSSRRRSFPEQKASFGRYYTFEFIPNGLFGRLIVRLLALQKPSNLKVWEAIYPPLPV